jgi:hemerythrin-like domain-containing protein
MKKAMRIIHDEHLSISAVLNGLITLSRAARDPGVQPEFPVFHAMIHYIDAFPERLHHPKEEQYIFARLAERSPETRPLIEELRAEHTRGAKLIREVESALLAFEVEGAPAAAAFAAAVDDYAKFHWDHMRKEE